MSWSSLRVAVLTNRTGRHTEVPLHRTWGIQFHSIRLTFLENFDTQVLTEQTHFTLQTNKSVGITSRASTPIHATTATSLQPGKNSPSQAMHATVAAMMMVWVGGWMSVIYVCQSAARGACKCLGSWVEHCLRLCQVSRLGGTTTAI